jgi:L-asparaginase
MKITFLQTGGTIDKDYPAGDNNHGYAFEITTPAVRRILEKLDPLECEYEIVECLKKDSLDITDNDRAKIASTCKSIPDECIVITHGTDTIRETAESLASLKDAKTIVLTGAMKPERFKDSDADFNLGLAVGAVSTLENGVYIALNGVIEKVS